MGSLLRARARILGTAGLPGLCTAYFTGSSPTTAAEALEGLTRVRALWEGIKTLVATGTTVEYIEAVDELDPSTGLLTGGHSVATPVTTVASGAGDILPLALMGLGQMFTSVIINGRRVRGRMFLGPMTESINTVGAPTGAAQITIQNGMATLGTTVVTPLAHVVWHRPVNQAGGAACAVSSYGSAAYWAVLRSRRD